MDFRIRKENLFPIPECALDLALNTFIEASDAKILNKSAEIMTKYIFNEEVKNKDLDIVDESFSLEVLNKLDKMILSYAYKSLSDEGLLDIFFNEEKSVPEYRITKKGKLYREEIKRTRPLNFKEKILAGNHKNDI